MPLVGSHVIIALLIRENSQLKTIKIDEVTHMQCPKCHYNGSRVVDSRPADDGRAIRRRRECEDCGFRFTTFERVEVTPLLVVKRMEHVKNSIVTRFYVDLFVLLRNVLYQWKNGTDC